jgi:hypothetical protein
MIPSKHLYREIKLGVKNLVLRSTRSLLTMLGMVFGVGSRPFWPFHIEGL